MCKEMVSSSSKSESRRLSTEPGILSDREALGPVEVAGDDDDEELEDGARDGLGGMTGGLGETGVGGTSLFEDEKDGGAL